MSSREIAREAAACADTGASVIHLHVRDDSGIHSLDAQRYTEAIAAVEQEARGKLLVQITTEAAGIYAPPQQMAVVRKVRPAAASLAICEIIPDEASIPAAAQFLAWADRENIALQYILYSPQQTATLRALMERGVIPQDRPNVLFVLGKYTARQQSNPADLLPFLANWPAEWPWSLCAFGASEAQCMTASIGLGGHVRVGFENNLQRPNGQTATSNADLIANVAGTATAAGRRPATVDEARRIYGATRA